jgi:hypothetical protein
MRQVRCVGLSALGHDPREKFKPVSAKEDVGKRKHHQKFVFSSSGNI